MQIQCCNCKHQFTPPPGLVLAVNEDVYVTCPRCGQRFNVTVSMQRIEV